MKQTPLVAVVAPTVEEEPAATDAAATLTEPEVIKEKKGEEGEAAPAEKGKGDAKPAGKGDAKPAGKGDAKPAGKAEGKAEAKPDAKKK